MNIAIFGATSEIAKDLIESFSIHTDYECTLFARNTTIVTEWIKKKQIQKNYEIKDYASFNLKHLYDVIINFVGVGDPAQAKKMGLAIFDVTYKYDTMVLDYLESHPDTKYIFLSSGAVYGGHFEQPVTSESVANVNINNLKSMDWYAISKMYAEARHRSLSEYSIVDIRVFNYFSHTLDINARFLITDIVRAVMQQKVFKTADSNILRDYITPSDFFFLVNSIINFKPINDVVDCYTAAPIDKFSLIKEFNKVYGLKYEKDSSTNMVNATGFKEKYYSLNRRASMFGYEPKFSSLEGILHEISYVL